MGFTYSVAATESKFEKYAIDAFACRPLVQNDRFKSLRNFILEASVTTDYGKVAFV